ncbi:aldose epimerase family protein [Streptococcus sp. A11]|uniref:aldose epimerase family protein n=1 Tax=Streptococcus sp. A11 TaxID=3373124 RepID=UPI00374CF2BC
MTVTTKILEMIDDKEVTQVRLQNKNGLVVSFLTLGATWQEFLVPQPDGSYKNLLLGFDVPSDYYRNDLFAGQTIGRVAGRIAKGELILGGNSYQLPINNHQNCLHGGPEGFHQLHWDYQVIEDEDRVTVVFSHSITEAHDGFPADMDVTVAVCLTNENQVIFEFSGANATKSTVFNPTTHPYFNLSRYQNLQTHELMVAADYVLETDDELIPSGQFLPVDNTPFDFRKLTNLSRAIEQSVGFDDAFVVNQAENQPIVVLRDRESGDQLNVYSERQGVVIYTMNSLTEGVSFARDDGKAGIIHEGIAIEPQNLPDAVHHEHFDSIILAPNVEQTYHIIYEYVSSL